MPIEGDKSAVEAFADFDSLDVKELKLRTSAAKNKLRTNDEKASFVSIVIILAA